MAKKKPKPQYAPTLAAVAKAIKVSESSIYGAQRRHDDFPTRRKRGYLLSDFERFAKLHSLWHHRNNAPGTSATASYNDARGAYLEERTARERIAREREQVEQAKELGQILDYDDVKRIFTQATGAIQAELGGFVAAIDAALGDSASPELRARVIAAAERSVAGVYSAVRLLFTKGDDDGKATTT